jgi:peptide chain release factor 2
MELKRKRQKLRILEKELEKANFWQDKENARKVLKEIDELKKELRALSKYDQGGAVVSIYSGAGGVDAEDWTKMLFDMYKHYFIRRGWSIKVLHEHRNEVGGIKNITFETADKGVYGTLKDESGVHRLVRISPFSAKKLRHTSFALVEVLPKMVESAEVKIKPSDLKIDFSRASGPGGQNVNKRETAIRLTHLPTGITVHVESERSQERNREKAIEVLRSRLYKFYQKKREGELEKFKVVKGVKIAWGHQIRSYILHPYKLVRDHRTGAETSEVERILDGDLDLLLKKEKTAK